MTNNSLTQPKDEVFECFGRLSKSFSICFTRYLARCKDNQKKNSIIWCHKRGEEDGNRQNNGAQLVSI